MGNRANYILKSGDEIRIFYTHWRAVNIAQDILLGPERLEEFILRFEQEDEILQYPWIEGLILMDLDKKKAAVLGRGIA